MTDHSPADILRNALSAAGLVGFPESHSWPAFVSSLPDAPDTIVCLFDTMGMKDGRIHRTGQTVYFPGLQLRVRSTQYQPGWKKITEITSYLDTILNQTVIVEGTSYTIRSVQRMSDPTSLGEDESKRRFNFVMNLRITLAVGDLGLIVSPPIFEVIFVQEVPSGTVDGVNATFVLSELPSASPALIMFLNGLAQYQGSSNDYTVSGQTVTFNAGAEPHTGDTVLAFYAK